MRESQSETTHTPGPWTANLHHTRISGGRAYAMVMGTSSIVPVAGAVLGAEGCSDEEGRANARLISAAPELLYYAKLFAKSIQYEIGKARKAGDDEGVRLMTLTLNLVNAAIRKAEGLSPV